jgi:hypothetical protein
MTVRLDGSTIRLEGRCRLEEAETLLGLLSEDRERAVDLADCAALHGAVAQILLAARPAIVGRPIDLFLCTYLLPLL